MNARLVTSLLLTGYVLSSTTGLVMIRQVLADRDRADPLALQFLDTSLIVGAALYALSFLFWLVALSRSQLSFIYPLFVGCGYASVTCASFLVLHESVSVVKIVGMSLVGLGVVLVAL